MKNFIMSFLFVITSACASSDIRLSRVHDGIDSQFNEYIKMFIEDSRKKVKMKDLKGLSMGFFSYPKDESTIGTCWPLGFITEIDISREGWESNPSYYWRKALIYHELGHCILGRNHTEVTESSGYVGAIERFFFRMGFWQPKGYLSDGCPASLMHPYLVSESCFYSHYNYYIEEMFADYNPKTNIIDFETDFGTDIWSDVVETNQHLTPLLQNKKRKCSPVEIINSTSTWNKRDKGTLTRAHTRCDTIYNSCLKRFIKTSELSYQAICGG